MRAEFALPISSLFAFLLILARVSGVLTLVPIPGIQGSPEMSRVALALVISMILFPVSSMQSVSSPTIGWLVVSIGAQFAFGLLIGVSVALMLEGMQIAAQIVGLQAGYSFASTVDPSTQADSPVLQIMTQLMAGSLFFALGLDRQVIRVLALSLQKVPSPAEFTSNRIGAIVVQLGSQMFVTGFQLALPVLALLILLDLSFGLMGKVHAQFQILSLAFPAKMLAGLSLLAITISVAPKLLESSAARTFGTLFRLLGI